MLVLIKGAGDLATARRCGCTGRAYRWRMTEVAWPTAVRRTVAFSPVHAYDGAAQGGSSPAGRRTPAARRGAGAGEVPCSGAIRRRPAL